METTRDTEQAIAEVLAAEREAEAAIARCRAEAEARLQAAQAEQRRIEQRAERRAACVQARLRERTQAEIDRRGADHARRLAETLEARRVPDQTLDRAAERLALELILREAPARR